MEFNYLQEKRIKVLEAIKPICEVFGIKDYDYVVQEKEQSEILRIGKVKIGCSSNSIESIIEELVGYIFIKVWCRGRYLGAFSTQTKNIIKEFWLKEKQDE